MDSFVFDKLTLKDVEVYSSSSNIFNLTEDSIESEKVILSSFEDERLGSSMEKLDVAVYNNGKWEILNIDDKIKGYNEIPLGYLLKNVSYERVLIVIRMMSTLLTDKVKSNIITYMYYKVDNRYKIVQDDKALFGKLAKYRVCLDGSEEMCERLKELGVYDKILNIS